MYSVYEIPLWLLYESGYSVVYEPVFTVALKYFMALCLKNSQNYIYSR